MNRISDREKVIDVYNDAKFDRNRNEPPERQCSIYDGPPDDGGRQISDQCATPAQAWTSASNRAVSGGRLPFLTPATCQYCAFGSTPSRCLSANERRR